MSIRKEAVAGYFYEANPALLKKRVENCFLDFLGPGRLPKVREDGPRKVKGLVIPHAGLMYSGPVAAHAYLALAEDGVPETIVFIGPNHTGLGTGVSIVIEGYWRSPLGKVEVDSKLALDVQKASSLIVVDEEAHLSEHSIEVQLPFLTYLYEDRVKIVPICMMLQSYDVCLDVGKAISKAAYNKNVVIAATSDFTHYESQKSAEAKDRRAIEAISKMDARGLMEVVDRHNISMCGPGPVASMIIACIGLGASKAELLKYATSGDVTKDYSAVVGYASIAIS